MTFFSYLCIAEYSHPCVRLVMFRGTDQVFMASRDFFLIGRLPLPFPQWLEVYDLVCFPTASLWVLALERLVNIVLPLCQLGPSESLWTVTTKHYKLELFSHYIFLFFCYHSFFLSFYQMILILNKVPRQGLTLNLWAESYCSEIPGISYTW